MGMNPYEADPKRVPKKDPYLNRSPHYGRYAPQADDFDVESHDWYSPEDDTPKQAYWTEVVRKYCIPENSLNVVGSRAAFAVGRVIVRIDGDMKGGNEAERYSQLNANELSSSKKAYEILKELNVTVPVILFCGTIDGKNTVVETRIPGVFLEVAWNYLSVTEKNEFKTQCQQILQRLASTDDHYPDTPSYVREGLNNVSQPDIPEVEHDILFAPREITEVLSLTHNDMVRSNIIVDNGRVAGITGWRRCGYFGLERAQKIHRLLRIPERSLIFFAGERSTQDQAWADLYDHLMYNGTSALDATQGADGELKVKAETPAASIEKVPAAQSAAHTPQFDGADELPTPKKISDLKRGSTSRASSIDRSSPSAPLNPSKLGPNARKSSSVSTKKASIATKVPQSKKRKLDTLDTESMYERRSNSPASSVKGPSVKKKASASTTGSPAPENKKGNTKKKKPPASVKRAAALSAGGKQQTSEQDDDSDIENPDEVFCICRRPDNHTWMIGCDGGCDDWFHGKCINIKQEDEELIDRYICPNCHEAGRGQTSWKPMCRLKGCRKPARVSKQRISKYCSDEHGREFMRQMTKQIRLKSASSAPTPVVLDRVRGKSVARDSRSVDGDGESAMETNDEDDEHDHHDSRPMSEELGSRGGVLTIGDLKAVIMGVSSSAEFRRLGDRLITPPPSASPPAKKVETKAEKEKEDDEDEDEDEEQLAKTKKGKKVKGKDRGKKETQAQKEDEQPEQGKIEELFSQNKLGLDIDPPGVHYSAAEEAKLKRLREQRDQYRRQRQLISQRNRFLGLVRARAKVVLDGLKAKEPKGGWKDICGWDERMAWNEEELDDWRQQTEVGRKAFEENKLGAEPVENLTSNGIVPTDDEDEKMNSDHDEDDEHNKGNQINNSDSEFAELSRGVCIKKRCDRHKQWVKIVQQDIQFEEAMLKTDFEACEKEAKAIVDGAILRTYAR